MAKDAGGSKSKQRNKAGRVAAPRPPKVRAADAVTPDIEAAPVSAAQEFLFLAPRKGREWSAVEVLKAIEAAREGRDDGESAAGVSWYRLATRVKGLYSGFAERVRGFPSFTAFAVATLDLAPDDVPELLRAAQSATEQEVKRLGRTKLDLAFRILRRLGLSRLESLEGRVFALPDGRETTVFDATRNELRAVLTVLGRPAPMPDRSSRRLKAEARRRNELFKVAREDDETLRTTKAKWSTRDGRLVQSTVPLDDDQFDALVRFRRRLDPR